MERKGGELMQAGKPAEVCSILWGHWGSGLLLDLPLWWPQVEVVGICQGPS